MRCRGQAIVDELGLHGSAWKGLKSRTLRNSVEHIDERRDTHPGTAGKCATTTSGHLFDELGTLDASFDEETVFLRH